MVNDIVKRWVRIFFIAVLALSVSSFKKQKEPKSSCPGIKSSSSLAFDDVIQHAADLASARREKDAHDCFSLAASIANNDEERNVAYFNLAVIQKELQRSNPLRSESPAIRMMTHPTSYCHALIKRFRS